MAKAASNDDIARMSYEEALQQLETIVSQLERGNVPLEESMTIFERGAALRAHCDARLKSVEARVEKLAFDGGGNPTGTEPLDVERQ